MQPALNDAVIFYVRCIGGEICDPSGLISKVDPLGLNPRKIAEDIARATQDWHDYKVTCKLTIQNRVARIDVVPSAENLIARELKIPGRPALGDKTIYDLTFDQLINVARQMRPRSGARKLEGTVKEILGTAQSMHYCTIDGKKPYDIVTMIRNGTLTVPEE
uniref:Ribosomal_L11 domain-containing protein n=1 Tax=Panagrellus redivivus TaxID=6233 RepID=A0A7E4ZX64_PANRE